MSNSRIAPIRPSIARFLKKQIAGFIREYEREVNRASEPPQPPAPEEAPKPPPGAEGPAQS